MMVMSQSGKGFSRAWMKVDRPRNSALSQWSWLQVCGFERGDVVGNTLKCIQGPATERHLIEQLMDDVKRGQPHQTVLTNYTKTGQAFKNEVQIEPVGEADGLAAPHFLARSRISPVRNLALGIFLPP